MRILLTGGTGFLGSHIAEQLDAQGADVRALVRPTSDTRFLEGLAHVTLLSGALSDKDCLLAATEGVDFPRQHDAAVQVGCLFGHDANPADRAFETDTGQSASQARTKP